MDGEKLFFYLNNRNRVGDTFLIIEGFSGEKLYTTHSMYYLATIETLSNRFQPKMTYDIYEIFFIMVKCGLLCRSFNFCPFMFRL